MPTSILVHAATQQALDSFLASPSHAVLLAGGAGLGKTHLARSTAARLLDVPEAKLASHAYYRELAPVKGAIAIESIRNLVGFFRLKVPGKSATDRVAIIQDADAMGREAQNALLKLLEEPPVASVLILTSSRPEQLLPTIRSRVQVVAVQQIADEQLRAHFEALGYAAAAISRAQLLASGSMAAMEGLLAEDVSTDTEVLTAVRQALGSTSYERLLLVDGLAKQKDAAAVFVATLLQVASASAENAASKRSASLARWHEVLQAAMTAQSALERNANVKLVLTDLMLSL